MIYDDHTLAAERSVICAMILGADTPDLSPRAMSTKAHALVYSAVASLKHAGEAIDLITLAEFMRRSGTLAEAGGPHTLAGILEAAVTTANMPAHVALIRRASQRRDLKTMSLALTGDLDAAQLPEDLQQRLRRMAELAEFSDKNRSPKALSEIYSQMDTVGESPAVPLGFEKFSGLRVSCGDLFVIGARPGTGKTAMLTTIAMNAALRGWQALFFSLEMDTVLIGKRLAQSGAGPELAIWVEDDPHVSTIDSMFAFAKAFVHDYSDRDTVILVDYLQLVRARGRFERRHELLGHVCRELKHMARTLNCPLIAGAQLSRATEQRGKDSRPQLSDLRESGEIEQTADEVMLLHREDKKTLARLAKYRMGQTFTKEIFFNPERTAFEDYEWA